MKTVAPKGKVDFLLIILVIFINNITIIIVMLSELRPLFGKVECDTLAKRIRGSPLTQTERNYMYRSIRPKLYAAQHASRLKLLQKSFVHTINIPANLHHYGYSMFGVSKGRIIPLEELIIHILAFDKKARHIEALPIVLCKNTVDSFRLLELATLHSCKNTLGYIIEVALMLSSKSQLKNLHTYLWKHKDIGIFTLGIGKDSFLDATSPSRVKKWNLRGRFFDQDFKKLGELYDCKK